MEYLSLKTYSRQMILTCKSRLSISIIKIISIFAKISFDLPLMYDTVLLHTKAVTPIIIGGEQLAKQVVASKSVGFVLA